MAVAGFVLQGSMGKSPLSRGWIMMPHAKSVQPGADKITSAWQLSHTHDGGCLWLCGLSLTLHLRLGGSYVPKAGLRLTPILLAQLPKCREYQHAPLLEGKQGTGSHAMYQETSRSLKKE